MTDQPQSTNGDYPLMLKEIQGHFEMHPWWKRRCEGTPLENDLPVRAADLASMWGRHHFAEIARLRAALTQYEDIAALIAAAPDLLSLVKRFVALPSGAWHPERHAAEEAELMNEARALLARVEAEDG